MQKHLREMLGGDGFEDEELCPIVDNYSTPCKLT